MSHRYTSCGRVHTNSGRTVPGEKGPGGGAEGRPAGRQGEPGGGAARRRRRRVQSGSAGQREYLRPAVSPCFLHTKRLCVLCNAGQTQL